MATLAAVVVELQKQNDTLIDVRTRLDQEAKARADAIRRADTARKKDLENKAEEKKNNTRDIKSSEGFKSGIGQGIREATGFNILSGIGSKLTALSTAVFGGLFGGIAVKTLTTQIGKMVGRGLIFGPAILLLETFGKDIMNSLITSLSDKFPGVEISDETVSDIADVAVEGLKTGLFLGTFFGKRGFIAGFLGEILAESIKKVLPEDMSLDDKIKLFGLETPITTDQLLTVGSILGAYFGPGLLYGSITKFMGGTALAYPGAKVGRNNKGRFTPLPSRMKSFGLGFRTMFGPMLLFGLGEAMGGYISNNVNEEAGKLVSNTMTAAAIGFMLAGPYGALAAGLFVLAAAGIGALANWIEDKRVDFIADTIKAAELADKKVKEGNFTNEDLKTLSIAKSEIIRKLELAPNRDDAGMLQEKLAKYSATLDAVKYEKGNDQLKATMNLADEIESFVKGGSSANISAVIASAAKSLRTRGKIVNTDNILDEIQTVLQKSISAGALSDNAMKGDSDFKNIMTFQDMLSSENIKRSMFGANAMKSPITSQVRYPSTSYMAPNGGTGSGNTTVGQIGDVNVENNNSSHILPSTLNALDRAGFLAHPEWGIGGKWGMLAGF